MVPAIHLQEMSPASGKAEPKPEITFRDAVFSWADLAITAGLEEVKLSMDHARLLADLGTGAVVRSWTIVVGLLSAVAVALGVVAVFLSAAPRH